MAKRLRLLAGVLSLLALFAVGASIWFYFELHRSLPQLDGTATMPGLSAPVTVERDTLGVPTIRGTNRADVARGLGFVHAQDRFFQMDVLRRHAAGELAELFGKAALGHDKKFRLHEFRALSHVVLEQLPSSQRALLQAYAEGVNAGLRALRARPFEYILLRAEPQPWQPEDSILVCYSMTLDLQDAGHYEQSLAAVRDVYGMEAVNFFAPLETSDDAALDGTTAPPAPVPSPKVIDLRRTTVSRHALPVDDFAAVGSNALALAGAHTANGAALLASDMHLSLRVPNIWYRASLNWPGSTITGVTLPGTPAVVAGSNGHIAWGFTNAYADTSDLVVVERSPKLDTIYETSTGPAALDQRTQTILVKGSDPVTITTGWTRWGPIVGQNAASRPLALSWIAHRPDAENFAVFELETARTAAEALAIAHRAGIPVQNFLVADADGTIGWTLAGFLPKRVGFDGRLPVSWAYGDRSWDGLLSPEEIPQALSPASGRLWSGNQRMVGGPALARLGDNGYENPARAHQLRDDLAALEHAQPRDLLAIQLDDRALFLERWQKLLLQTLTLEAAAQKKSRAELRRLVEQWSGRASADSVSYRLVRAFRAKVAQLVFDPIFAPCVDAYPNFEYNHFRYEQPLWTMLEQKPPHLLNPRFKTWDELLLAAADAVVTDLDREDMLLDHATWGRRNTARIGHPLSRFLPVFLARFLDMPADELPGDTNLPRVAGPAFGASERFVVSPGHEDEGIFEMPCGQSGHPLSPFYRAGHEAWVHGEPTPFLPGKTVHTLELKPEAVVSLGR